MKKTIAVTLLTSILLIALFLAADQFLAPDEDTGIKAGFIYVGDGANAYTKNFMSAQEEIEETYGDRVECIAKYNIAEGKEAKYIEELVDAGCDIIFGTSYGYGDSMKAAAEAHPNVVFCQATCSNAQEEPVLDNYHTSMGHIYEGRYVSGLVAGLKLKELIESGEITEDQAIIGYVAAYPYAEVISGYTAFFLGVRANCPQAVMKVKYTNTWNEYTIEKEYAEELINEGCVIISQHSDTAGPAVACENAAADHPVYLVSYNQSMIDIAPTSALTGCRINWAPYELAAVDAVLNGKDIEASMEKGVVINGQDAGAGFSEGWVEMLPLNSVLLTSGIEETVQQCISDIEKKKLQVFQGDYTGTDPFDPSDTIDLTAGYQENASASAPSFHYVLDDVIEIEDQEE